MTPPNAEQVARFAHVLDRLAPLGQLAVAVSGGPDSLALLLLADRARPGRMVAATVDHQLRPESSDEAAMVAALCRRMAVPHRTLDVVVADCGDGLQAAAREARYGALTAWAFNEGASALATAHHLDDQAETVLMRLARGAGVAGLAGVRATRPIGSGLALIRPLLGWRKAELIGIVAAAGLSAIDDPSNDDPRFDRTRARRLLADDVLPPERLAAVAARMADADAALGWQTARLARERLDLAGSTARLDAGDLPGEFRRRLLLVALARLLPDSRPPRGEDIDRLIARLDADQVSTLAGVRIEPGRVWRLSPAPPRRVT